MSRTSYYAGINKRCVAMLIDGIFLSFLYFIACGKAPNPGNNPKGFIIYSVLITVISWIYFAGMESSELQATFGKRVLGIVVTDTNGNKISFGKATGRYFAKSVCIPILIVAFIIGVMGYSAGGENSPYLIIALLVAIIGILILPIGFLMAGFTPEKQALHDIIARCLVVNGSGQSTEIPWKIIIGLAIAAILSRVVMAQFSPTPVPPKPDPPGPSPNPTISVSPTISPTPTPTFTPTETPEPPVDNGNSNIPKSGKFTICGSEEQLIEPGNNNIDGDWRLQFSGGAGAIHVARLKMKGDSGIMRVIFRDSSGNTGNLGKVDQTMQLYNSSQGLVLLGFNPVNPDTGERVNTYQADNFIIRQELDGSITVRNCDDGGNVSPVKVEPYNNNE